MNSIVTMGMFPDKVSGEVYVGGGGVITKVEKEKRPIVKVKQIIDESVASISIKKVSSEDLNND